MTDVQSDADHAALVVRCQACGSENVWWDPADGWCCGGCGRTDADE